MDGILYKGRMNNQDGARPLTGVEELAGEGRQAFLGTAARCPGFTGQCEGLQAGPTAGTLFERERGGGGLHIATCKKWGPTVCQALYQVPGRQRGVKI